MHTGATPKQPTDAERQAAELRVMLLRQAAARRLLVRTSGMYARLGKRINRIAGKLPA